jgi:pimeloyl-ACP methyl ester carboxylesterase
VTATPRQAGRTPLALLPGVLCDAALWRPQLEALADVADMHVPDFSTQDSMAAMAAAALRAMPERFAMAGLSMGGAVAMEVMRRAPGRVTRLALLDTHARVDGPAQVERRRSLLALAEQGNFEGVTQRLLPMLVHESRLNDRELVEVVFAMAERVGRQAFVNQQRALLARPDSRRDLVGYRCPTLVLCGRQDAMTPFELHAEMAAAIASSRLVVIEECGHLSSLERPEAVNDALRAWLAA